MKFEDFISRFEKKRKTQLGWMVRCPSHDDSEKTPSLHVCPARDGGVLLKCFAGCTANQVVESLSLKMADLFAESKAVKFTPPAAKESGDSKVAPEKLAEIEKIYSYTDANGVELYQAIRLKPKSFRQRHRVEGKWIWNMNGVERVLYRLPKIITAQAVWVTEGEKDVESLVALGFEATCNVGGSKSWLESYGENFTGKDVVICGDNDQPGEEYVKAVAESVAPFAKTVRVVKLPSATKDVSDFIATFKTDYEAKLALAELHGLTQPRIKGHWLPLHTIGEMESGYSRSVRSMGSTSFSLGKWLPTLGMRLRSLVPGELVFLIGDTGAGKTGVMQSIARAALPLPTIFFELELPMEMMFERFVSMQTRMTGEQVESAYQSTDESISDMMDAAYLGLVVCPVSRLTTDQMENIILHAELKLGERPRVVLIDYIQLIKGEGQNRREKTSDIAEELKVMAKATRTIIIVSSQIARPKDVDADWEPSLHSAKESGSIEASCGLLLSVWQDMRSAGELNLRVLKSTKGGTGTFVKCNFDGARMLITEQSKLSDEDMP